MGINLNHCLQSRCHKQRLFCARAGQYSVMPNKVTYKTLKKKYCPDKFDMFRQFMS